MTNRAKALARKGKANDDGVDVRTPARRRPGRMGRERERPRLARGRRHAARQRLGKAEGRADPTAAPVSVIRAQ